MQPTAALLAFILTAEGGVAKSTGPNYIGPGAVALAACLVLVLAVISAILQLGLEVQLLIATVRCVVQLSLLGYILVPIFTSHKWYIVLGYAILMALVGAYEAASRPAYTFRGILAEVVGCTIFASSIFLTYALIVVVRTKPWWEPQYFIPMLGMVLGNCISSISVGLSALLEDFTTGKDKIELLLALGATRWEASKATVARCVRLALTPILNQMNVVGIVSIPGMMTGQILGGSDPSQAARYQMVIMFVLAATSCVGATLTILLATASILDAEHRLRPERLVKQTRGQRLEQRIQELIHAIGERFSQFWKRLRSTSGHADGYMADPLLPS